MSIILLSFLVRVYPIVLSSNIISTLVTLSFVPTAQLTEPLGVNSFLIKIRRAPTHNYNSECKLSASQPSSGIVSLAFKIYFLESNDQHLRYISSRVN